MPAPVVLNLCLAVALPSVDNMSVQVVPVTAAPSSVTSPSPSDPSPLGGQAATATPPVTQNTPPEPATTPPPAPSKASAEASKAASPSAPGEIVVTATGHHAPGDPFQGINRTSYRLVQDVDQALVVPAAHAYKRVVPSPIRRGLHNFLSNLGEPVIALNFMLQLHPGRAFKTVGRFAINTTIGIGGILDVAKTKTFGLPYHPNGFGDTLGYYGVKPGPYFYVPLLGATTLRDFIGYTVDGFGLPTVIGKPFNKLYYTIPANTIRALDYRVQYDSQLREIRESANPYVSARVTYLHQREEEIAALHSHHDHAAPAVSVPATITGPTPVNPGADKPAASEPPAQQIPPQAPPSPAPAPQN